MHEGYGRSGLSGLAGCAGGGAAPTTGFPTVTAADGDRKRRGREGDGVERRRRR